MTSTTTPYEIKGYYFKENGQTISDTHFHYSDTDSMIDHQTMWYKEAEKVGYHSGELNEAAIIEANYKGNITNEQMIAIINNGSLMEAPFGELFPGKINAYLTQLRQSEYAYHNS
ncbi:hypothetical protein HXA34_20210 [Salipaludibacillus agaradhaerens]|jgi:hypothetical protein|uniref:hypothetical protein n=1 Tax=Salipaludibacillus agaradhaerens TaxID=76935 RepID=UPI002150F3CB|nr:hypothetical protein [Salipaludibacillus agaradhaerens]MCR6108617.1 hypothetical protein [Salipaludibacillus agaradhaerens]MCR6120645.1 hypothetical protein [Salipaludibacillus agaradhaerens]